MAIHKILKTKDGTVTFKGSLTSEEHEYILAVGLNTLLEAGALPMQVADEEDLADYIPGENPVQ